MTGWKGLLNRRVNCPCCWDKATGADCGLADCMPFSFTTGGTIPALDGSYSTCVSNALPEWATTEFEPVAGRVYATPAQTANDCTFYFAQYCTVNAEGTNGRSWVAEYWCSGDGGETVAHLFAEVLDWECTCEGARFTHEFEGATLEDYGCCAGPGDVETPCCPDGVPRSLVASFGGCLNIDVPLEFSDYYFTTFGIYYWQGTVIDPVDPTKCLNVRVQCNSAQCPNQFNLTAGCGTQNLVSGECVVPPGVTFNVSAGRAGGCLDLGDCDPFTLSDTFLATGANRLYLQCSCSTAGTIPVTVTAA